MKIQIQVTGSFFLALDIGQNLCASLAKPSRTLKFGVEKCLLQSQARRMGSSCSENSELPDGFQGKFYRQNLG